MDELKLNLASKFIKGIITKLIGNAIRKKFGYNIDILLNKIDVTSSEGKIYLHLDVEAETTNEEFMKMISTMGLE